MNQFVFHHIGIAVRDLQTAVLLYKELFQYELESGPFDDPVQNVSVCFLSSTNLGPLIELVAPLGPNSPVDRALKQAGGGDWPLYREGCPPLEWARPRSGFWDAKDSMAADRGQVAR